MKIAAKAQEFETAAAPCAASLRICRNLDVWIDTAASQVLKPADLKVFDRLSLFTCLKAESPFLLSFIRVQCEGLTGLPDK
ncbi:hypothetical protein HUB94_22800 (plasmid) [Paenibacillus cellulosilyticus]|nr:hypothetical protein HUB94_22800 [Paenibacillus cellulosilyticus]